MKNKQYKSLNKKRANSKKPYEYKDEKDIIKKLKIKMIEDPIEKSIKAYQKDHYGEIPYYNYELIKRITLNFIRHNLTNYDIIVNDKSFINDNFKSLVNEKIMKKYRSELGGLRC